MEEKRHVCKLCSKRFPCGRSLGGHMRSHVIFSNNDNNSDQTVDYKNIQMKLNSSSDCLVGQTGYRLRENPRRTFRFEYEDEKDEEEEEEEEKEEENTFDLKMCKECGRGFQSWKALFGHMKCHSDKVHLFEEHSSSWTNNNNSQLDNDTSALQTPYTRKISRRKRSRTTRYMADSTTTTTNSSSLSLANYASSSVSNQFDQEQQQEVALCLMMLSRDVTNWLCVNSDEDSFDRYDHLAHDGDSVFDSRNRFKVKKQIEELGSTNKHNSSKRRLREADLVVKTSYYDDLGSGYPEKPYKSNKFECTTCNKIFCSYQALGGHRASHKKTKGCSVSVSKRESSENSFEIMEIQYGKKNSIEGSEVSNGKLEKPKMVSKKLSSSGMKLYECPICLKFFTSGQALGGHKRSHLVHGSKPKYGHDHDHDHEDIVIQNKDHEFIDLNLPAPNEEENYHINGQVGLKLKPWWIESRLSVRL